MGATKKTSRKRGKGKKKGGQTPLMRQYWKIKERHPGAILLFRMGDFYETFADDAELVSRILGITLTKRANGKASEVPLAGFPHHALDTHLPKLVQAGHRVAVCEQLEDPKYAKKIVKRGVVEVVTPGVSFHDQMLDPKRSNYLAAVHWGAGQARGLAGLAFADVTTGEFSVAEVEVEALPELLATIQPAELLFDKRLRERVEGLGATGYVATPQEDWMFGFDFAYETLLRHFQTHSLKGFGVDGLQTGLVAAGAVLYYLGETQKGRLSHIRRLSRYSSRDYIALDPQTKRNLELVVSMQHGHAEGTLVQILDDTLTPMGGRLLRKWVVRPLRKVSAIERRLDAVDALVRGGRVRAELRDALRPVGDLERLVTKVCLGRANPRDVHTLRLALEQIPDLVALLGRLDDPALARLAERLDPCVDTIARIEAALVPDPPASVQDGGVIRVGFSEELDRLREVAASGKQFLSRLQTTEAERTGIPSLKVGFNKVFGYYIEITNPHKDKVPEHYIRKQTLVSAERYITPELKEFEEQILTAEEQIGRLETELFEAVRAEVAEEAAAIQLDATLIGMLDVFQAFAELAERRRYVRPGVHEGTSLEIEDGRHPVVEATLPPGEPFIPNSVRLDPEAEQILIITGPNMAGKSVVLRQVGLIVLLAQVGCFVPARRASIGIVDKIFTRVGASDNLAAGESTFLVEMNETANILNNATPRSLILLDEVGRGTSTFDGLSIAWAIVEFLHEQPSVAARTLFATHYHELNALAERYPRVRNARIQVQEHDGKVIFLRKLIPGGADHSYGIEVARMAGLPEAVVARAREVLHHLESHQNVIGASGDPAPGNGRSDGAPAPVPAPMPASVSPASGMADLDPPSAFQMSLFSQDPRMVELRERLEALDPDRLAPIEALLELAELKRLIAD